MNRIQSCLLLVSTVLQLFDGGEEHNYNTWPGAVQLDSYRYCLVANDAMSIEECACSVDQGQFVKFAMIMLLLHQFYFHFYHT